MNTNTPQPQSFEGSDLDLDALEKIAREATDGPWEATGSTVWNTEYSQVCCGRGYDSCCGEAEYVAEQREIAQAGEVNAAYIATFDPPTILSLISAAREGKGTRAQSHPFAAQESAVGEGGGSGAWRPIESAPRDGTHVLIACAAQRLVGEAYFREDDGGLDEAWWWANEGPGDYHAEPVAPEPTH